MGHQVTPFVGFVVGDGEKVKFWKDKWCETIPLSEAFPSLFALALNKEAWVNEVWTAEGEVGTLVSIDLSTIGSWKKWKGYFIAWRGRRYGAVKDIADSAFVPSKVPDGKENSNPISNSQARHGTRSPTKKRMRELDNLATHLESLLRDVKEQNLSLKKVPAWLWGWKSPWKGKVTGGELTDVGEIELYHLAIRIRERFPDLFNEEYHPDVFTIKATQVPRASASAVAFGMGLFSGRGSLGPGHQRAFAVTSESRASDILLRFFECCQNYKDLWMQDFRKSQEPAVDELKEPIFDEITATLRKRYGLNFTRQDTSSLWFLCKQEASLLDITDQACGLFSPSEVALLEWTDDLELFILKGYGKSLNYQMGVPLLKDVFQSMEQAIKAKEGNINHLIFCYAFGCILLLDFVSFNPIPPICMENILSLSYWENHLLLLLLPLPSMHVENYAPGSYEKARLRFAHAETVVPFSCLLGLFLEQSEFKQMQREEPLQYPPKPPQKRNWRGSTVAPFAGNNMLVLYSCPANSSSKYFVQVLHNEHPIPMPGCDNSDLCPFEVFKERIVTPHMKHEYYAVCNVKLEKPEQKPATSKLSQLFHWLFSQRNDDTRSLEVDL
ncbi:Multiple inositol polyphosphate phosphatase 1 [Vitis vinifera]|uniref:Multiple inositol polyphosphate phosphatase 1 n=1 Tax=Vitis vinifera TaxID=29760 RepID=A0A438E3R6_VITVI|nr:Multiple inositol polyphosphate phosphatase 1 [Vitis vinifera]